MYLQYLDDAEENCIRHVTDLIIWSNKQETGGSQRTRDTMEDITWLQWCPENLRYWTWHQVE